MPKERGEKVVATNRRARHEYNIEKTYEAGLVLTGTEVKSLRQGRTRKLLLHKDEIIKLSHAVSAGGYTLVPLKLYFSDGRAKVEIAIAKGKHEWDKRQTLRERQDKREAERAMRSRNRLGD